MAALTVHLPGSVHRAIETLAARDGVSASQFVASAAAEKMAIVMTLDYLRSEAADGRRDADGWPGDAVAAPGRAPGATPPPRDAPV